MSSENSAAKSSRVTRQHMMTVITIPGIDSIEIHTPLARVEHMYRISSHTKTCRVHRAHLT